MNLSEFEHLIDECNRHGGAAIFIPFPLPEGEKFRPEWMINLLVIGDLIREMFNLTVGIAPYELFIDPEKELEGFIVLRPFCANKPERGGEE